MLEAQMHQGEYHGLYKSWWDNGQLKEEGVFHHGARIGRYRWYKQSGEIWQEHDYGSAPTSDTLNGGVPPTLSGNG